MPSLALKRPAQLIGDTRAFSGHKKFAARDGMFASRMQIQKFTRSYAVTYLPASTIRLAICCVNAITL